VRITLDNGRVVTETGALHFMKGHIQAENQLSGILKKLSSSMLTSQEPHG
jgi:uncharacterized protein (AIM24 family)